MPQVTKHVMGVSLSITHTQLIGGKFEISGYNKMSYSLTSCVVYS